MSVQLAQKEEMMSPRDPLDCALWPPKLTETQFSRLINRQSKSKWGSASLSELSRVQGMWLWSTAARSLIPKSAPKMPLCKSESQSSSVKWAR